MENPGMTAFLCHQEGYFPSPCTELRWRALLIHLVQSLKMHWRKPTRCPSAPEDWLHGPVVFGQSQPESHLGPPQIWTEFRAIKPHISVHTDARPTGLQMAPAAFWQKKNMVKISPTVFSVSSSVNPHTHGVSCGAGAIGLNSAWAGGHGGCGWHFKEGHPCPAVRWVLSSAAEPMGGE